MSNAASNDTEKRKQKQNGLHNRDSEERFGKLWKTIFIFIKELFIDFKSYLLTLSSTLKLCYFCFRIPYGYRCGFE